MKQKKEKKIMFVLTKEQNKHMDTLLWLFNDDNRQEGRSILLAFTYIIEALKG